MVLNTILRLRRDNDFNYAKIKDKFIPANGEICLVDTARSGLRVICGDGATPFGQLEYVDNIYVKGYLYEGKFYKDNAHTELYAENTNLLYIDLTNGSLCYFDGQAYQVIASGQIGTAVGPATEITAGIMKLYSTTGSNTDGTMSQKAITDELNEKVEVTLNIDEELIIFSND